MMLSHKVQGPQDGPLVLFLHAGGVSSLMWRDVLGHLPDVRALLVDLPGHGESRDLPWLSLPEVAVQVEEVIADVAGQRPCHIAALSLGSYVAAHLLAAGRVRCVSAVLSGMHAGQMPNKFVMKLMSAIMAPLTNKAFVARRNGAMLLGLNADIDAYVADAVRSRTRAVRRAVFDVIEFEAPGGLANTDARVLFCTGAKEHTTILSGVDQLADMVPLGSALRVPEMGHGWPGQNPALFARTLLLQMDEKRA